MKRLEKEIYLLHVLKNTKCEKFKKAIIRHCPDDTIQCISEIIHNAAINNFNFKPCQVKKLRKYKTQFEKLHKNLLKKKTVTARRKILIKNQSGGFLGSLLTAALGALIDYGVNKISDTFTKDK